jgi:transcriptional regulator with XRE-family HTH domain
LNFSYLSQIETGARKGTTATMKKLAESLSIDLDDLA